MRYCVTMIEPPERMVSTGLRIPKSLLDRLGAVAKANRRTRADMHRVLLEDAITAAEKVLPPAQVDGEHLFAPKPGNALKCATCGLSKGQHRKE
jgi:hypothetical protein